MAKQTFTTGQVLTAAQMTSLQQTAMLGGAASAKTASYTLVAADAGTAISMSNASATTITVNTALFAAGDTVQITNIGAGVCTITAGTATVNTASSLALAQYESGTLDFTSTSAAIFIKGAGAAAGGGGKVLQVVQGTKLDTASTTSTTFTASGVSISITPTSATSKVLIISQVNIGSDAVSYPYISLYRAGSAIFQGDTAGNRPRVTSAAITTNANFIVTVPVTYLDSPATTSATTYELYFRSSEGQTVWINKSNTDNNATTYSPRGASSIIALEIGA